MKRTFILLITVFTFFNIYSQSGVFCKKKIDVNPSFFLKQVQELKNNKNYDSIISIINTDFINDTTKEIWPYYQLACFYSLKNDSIESVRLINLCIENHVDMEDILSDPDFENLRKTALWKPLSDRIDSIYLAHYPNIKDTLLSLQLWKLGIQDQKNRTLKMDRKENKNYSPPEVDKIFKKETNERTKFIKNLVKEGIWPTKSLVGETASNDAFLIIQHSDNNKLIKKSLKLMKQQIDSNEVNIELYAMALDRYLGSKKKKQVYGTQIYRFYQDGKWSEFFLEPVEDEVNLNKRRSDIGLPPIEDYTKKFGFKYIYHPEFESLSYRKIRKIQNKQYK